MKFTGSWTHGTAAFGIFISDLSQAANVAGYNIHTLTVTEVNEKHLNYDMEITRDWRDLKKIFETEKARYV